MGVATRILTVEDDERIRTAVKLALEDEGWTVEEAETGEDALNAFQRQPADVVLIDIMLPGVDGFGVLKALRAQANTPVLMLTARDRVEDRVRGLQEGADDYLVKPFAFSELLARVGALLRRGGAANGAGNGEATQLRLADLEVDLASRKAWRGKARLTLTAKEFNLLTLLLRRRGQILSRTTLAEQIWDMNFDSDTNVVEVAVRRLRAKLDDPFESKLLHTVRGMGYVLEERAA